MTYDSSLDIASNSSASNFDLLVYRVDVDIRETKDNASGNGFGRIEIACDAAVQGSNLGFLCGQSLQSWKLPVSKHTDQDTIRLRMPGIICIFIHAQRLTPK